MVLCTLSDMWHALNCVLHAYCRNVTRHTSNDDVNDAFIIVESFCAKFDLILRIILLFVSMLLLLRLPCL